MERRTKILILTATVLAIIITAASFMHMLKIGSIYSFKAACYSYKVTVLEDNTYSWDISIARYMEKSNIIQTETNEQKLTEFRQSVKDISKKLFSLCSLIIYTIYALIIFIFVQHDRKVFKNNRNKKAFLIFIIAFNLFLLIRFYIEFVELKHVERHIKYIYQILISCH